MVKSFILSAFLLLALVGSTMAHAIHVEFTEHAPAITLWAGFSKSAPMTDARVEVLAPGDAKAFQHGRTDKYGQYTFLPDAPGEWTLRVDDERGHRKTATIAISEAFLSGGHDVNKDAASSHEHHAETLPHHKETGQNISFQAIPLVYKAVFGLSIIFGITGIFYGLKARKQ